MIPVPSKGFGLLQKLPPPLFPHPYGFPTAFGLCPKKDDPVLGAGEPKGGPGPGSGGGAGTGAGAGGPGTGHLPPGAGTGPGGGAMFWGHQPSGAAKDAAAVAAAAAAATVYPTFPMFWPAAGSLPVPPYPAAQSQAKAVAAAVAAAAAAAAAAAGGGGPEPLDGSEQTKDGGLVAEERCPSALSRGPLDEDGADEALPPPLAPLAPPPPPPARKGSYVSAFRPVVKDAESIAKLYGSAREAYGGGPARGPGPGAGTGGGYVSPDFLSEGSSSYHSASPDVDTADEPEVDVESNRFPDDEGAPDEAEPGAPSTGGSPNGDQPAGPPSITSSGADGPTDSPEGGSPRPRHRPGLPLASRAAFGDLAADDMVRRPEKSPPSGGYELREACGPLGGPAPAKVSPKPASLVVPPCLPLGSSGLWGRPWPGGGLEVFSERAFKQ